MRQDSTENLLEASQLRLWNYLRSGNTHPAIVLSGPDREKKFQLAKDISKFFLCRNKNGFYCGQCSCCQRVERELHPDVLFCRDDDGEPIKIDTIREIRNQMEVGGLESATKLCIIDEAHRMNAAAANAFLKTLEEPQQGRYFWLLTTQLGSLLPTLLSRCLNFHCPSQKESIDAEQISQFKQLFCEYLKSQNLAALRLEVESKELSFVKSLQTYLHHAVCSALKHQPIEANLTKYSPYQLMLAFDAAVVLEGRLRSNANSGLMLENLLIRHFSE